MSLDAISSRLSSSSEVAFRFCDLDCLQGGCPTLVMVSGDGTVDSQ